MSLRIHGRLMLAVICLLCASAAAAAREDGAPRPNLLFIYADDHSPKTVGCYEGAYPMARTPNIDGLAASGVRFRAAYLGSWCMPSRASLLTGLHPHGIESMRMSGAYPGSTSNLGEVPPPVVGRIAAGRGRFPRRIAADLQQVAAGPAVRVRLDPASRPRIREKAS